MGEDLELREATDGDEAWAELQKGGIDLAVLDHRMPGRSGFDLCRLIRAEPTLAHLPIILLTGSVRSDEISQGFEAGASRYLAKPFSPRELMELVDEVLAGVANSSK
jgi:CheY-like chemotaxis protein